MSKVLHRMTGSPGKDILLNSPCQRQLLSIQSDIMARFVEKRFLPSRTVTEEERERIEQAIKERLLREPGILFVYLHGSFANENSFRDIDVGIVMVSPMDLTYEADLSYELSRTLGHEVELKVINGAPVAFQMAVLRGGRLLFTRDDEARSEFIEDVGRRYREYAHFRNIFMEAVGAER